MSYRFTQSRSQGFSHGNFELAGKALGTKLHFTLRWKKQNFYGKEDEKKKKIHWFCTYAKKVA